MQLVTKEKAEGCFQCTRLTKLGQQFIKCRLPSHGTAAIWTQQYQEISYPALPRETSLSPRHAVTNQCDE